MVGTETVKSLQSGCACKVGNFGPFCDWDEPTEDAKKLCKNGVYNANNYLTGCDCKTAEGHVTPFHGWYCEVHNRNLCAEGEFYDVTNMSNEVGKCTRFEKCCKNCGEIIKNCALCKQDEDTQCKLSNSQKQKKILNLTRYY